MTANLILVALTALMGLLGLGLLAFRSAQDQSTGAKLEAAKINAVAAKAEVAIAQAEVDAPATQQAVVDRLKSGSF